MPTQLEARLRGHLRVREGDAELLFTNKRGRPLSANKLRKKVSHPLLEKLGIPRGGFHSLRHGADSAPLADGATPAVVQKQLRHSDPRITLGVYGHVIGNQQRDAVEIRSARIEQHGELNVANAPHTIEEDVRQTMEDCLVDIGNDRRSFPDD
jgi:integrase